MSDELKGLRRLATEYSSRTLVSRGIEIAVQSTYAHRPKAYPAEWIPWRDASIGKDYYIEREAMLTGRSTCRNRKDVIVLLKNRWEWGRTTVEESISTTARSAE
jgi:hypothetical protein